MQFVDEEDYFALGRRDLGEDGLQALLELAAVLGSGDQRSHVERPHTLALEAGRDVTGDDALGEAFGNRGLADAGLADQDRVVLRPAREHLDRAANLLVATDNGVELARLRGRGQVAPVLRQRLVGALGILGRHALAPAYLLQGAQELVAWDELERQYEMLDRHELIAKCLCLGKRTTENLLEALPSLWLGVRTGNAREGAQPRLCLGPDRALIGARSLDERPRQLLLEQRHSEVVACHLRVAGATRELLRACHGLAGLDRELVEIHLVLLRLLC